MDVILPHVDAAEADPDKLPYQMSLPDLDNQNGSSDEHEDDDPDLGQLLDLDETETSLEGDLAKVSRQPV